MKRIILKIILYFVVTLFLIYILGLKNGKKVELYELLSIKNLLTMLIFTIIGIIFYECSKNK
jgi:hypothetical protein